MNRRVRLLVEGYEALAKAKSECRRLEMNFMRCENLVYRSEDGQFDVLVNVNSTGVSFDFNVNKGGERESTLSIRAAEAEKLANCILSWTCEDNDASD